MQKPVLPEQVTTAARAIAQERSLRVAFDTHYDAGNVELQRWEGNVLYRLDLQPMPEGHIIVTAFSDTYPFLGRILRWVWRAIPMFPCVSHTEHRDLGTIRPPFEVEALKAKLKEFVATA